MVGVLLQATGSVDQIINQVLGVAKPVMTAMLDVFAIMFWLSFAVLMVWVSYRVLGVNPGMRSWALGQIIDWAVNHVTWFLAVYIALWLVITALSLVASAAGVSLPISLGTVLYDFVIKPIVTMFSSLVS